MIKVCFIQHASEFPLFKKIADALRPKGIDIVFANKTRHAHEEYKKDGYQSFFITKEIFERAKTVTGVDMKRISEAYGLSSIANVCNSDVHLWFLYPHDRAAQERLVAAAFLFWERFFTDHGIQYVLCREVATVATRTACTVALQRGIPVSTITIGPGEGLFIMGDMGKTSMWRSLEEYVARGFRRLAKEEKEEALRFVEKRVPKSTGAMHIRFAPPALFSALREYVSLWRHDTAKELTYDPIRVAALRYGRYLVAKRLQWKYITQHFFTYDKVQPDEEFVYFPLYSGYETGYLTDDHFWAIHEKDLILEVATNLPLGVKLYVKEHPHNPGDLTYAELKKLKSHPNVKVLHPRVSSQLLIEKSKAVFVLQGTAGWEAFLSKKPVVSVGTSFFSYSPLVYKVERMSDIASVLDAVFRSGARVYDGHEEEWLWFVYGAISTCGKGHLVRLQPPYGFVTDKKEAEAVVDFIFQKISREATASGKRETY